MVESQLDVTKNPHSRVRFQFIYCIRLWVVGARQPIPSCPRDVGSTDSYKFRASQPKHEASWLLYSMKDTQCGVESM